METKPSASSDAALHALVRSGLSLMKWAFILMLVTSVFNLIKDGGYPFFLPLIAPILGLLGVAKLKQAMAAASAGTAPARQVPIAVTVPETKEEAVRTDLENRERQRQREEERPQPKRKEEDTPPISLLGNGGSPFENVNWEEWIGKKLLQKLGVIIVLIGMVVLLKYSIDNRIIGEMGRIALAAFGAIALLGAGEWFHTKYSAWSQAFTGGGLALLYFTVWATHILYRAELLQQYGISVSPVVAMILYTLITIVGALAAIRYDAQTVAWFTVLGGYATPFLIEATNASAVSLTLYLAILAGGLLTLSWFKKWRHLTIASFVLTQLYLYSMYDHQLLPAGWATACIAVGFFALFSYPPLLAQFRLGRKADQEDLSLIIANGAISFLAVCHALGGFSHETVGFVSLGLAAVYLTFAAATLMNASDDPVLLRTYLLAGIGLVALAIYTVMRFEWVAAGWAAFSVLLLVVAVQLKQRSVMGSAYALLGGALAFLVFNMPVFAETSESLWHPFTSHWALLSYAVFACVLAWMYLSTMVPADLHPSEEARTNLLPGLHTVVALLIFAGVTFEATGLHWVITLPLAIAYVAFAALAIVLFAVTGMIVWLVAAFAVQILVLLFTFVFGGASGMVSPVLSGSASVLPFLHPWAGVSALTLLALGGSLFVILKKGNQQTNTPTIRGLLITIAAVQVWVHFTVEIQHLQTAFNWSDPLFQRVLSAWWIIFSVPFLSLGMRAKKPFIEKAAIFALFLPLLKDLLLITAGRGDLYEVGLWTVIPLIAISSASRLGSKNLLQAGCAMLAAVTAVDMLHTLANDNGLLRTVWWAVVGLVTIGIGFLKREQLVRKLAIGIFAATVVKLLFFDFAMLSTGVRIVASILTGLLLIGASYLYQRFDSALETPAR